MADCITNDDFDPVQLAEADCECCPLAVVHGVRLGGAILGGLMGMAEAIRLRDVSVHTNLWCPRCVGLELGHHPDCNWTP